MSWFRNINIFPGKTNNTLFPNPYIKYRCAIRPYPSLAPSEVQNYHYTFASSFISRVIYDILNLSGWQLTDKRFVNS